MAEFIARRRVEFANTDMAGIVHFSNFYRWMEEAEHEYFRSLGLTIMQKRPDGSYIGWPRVSASCHFEAPAFHEDELEIRLRVERIGYKSLTFYAEFFRGDKRLAHGRMKTACCICGIEGTLESIRIPDEYRTVIVETPAS
ncbi:1,4-dihydroxy-2-naphthoyl-CoA hydrolase [Thalassoglobus neptunius]|uniref:1,4-dihydroxy-2-naphthoyl-CoA hydrolase n=1 Tax=Thalassoglobus neptunius TaxID=1938619 RepID=A0A5C5W7T4_9PLAN|nr:thioesterase family protein [Thalassoglobus neptunius]TWT46956.1 1,4-dihydroxy-2-naphthoyl-CoA hydrolase [Thalassoglobus neptunius]